MGLSDTVKDPIGFRLS